MGALGKPISPFLSFKKGRSGDDFVVRAWGLPRRGKPEGAISVGYGPGKLPFRKLDAASRREPCEKLIKVELLDPKSASLNKVEREVKKNLLNLRPDRYYHAMSDPKMGLRERAALQSLKPRLNSVWALLQDSLREIHNGYRNTATGYVYKILNKLSGKRKWAVSDHLLHRFTRWVIGEIKRAKRVLLILGLTAQEVALALPSRKRSGRRLDCAQLVSDKLYTTGMAFRHWENPIARRITELGIPALTPVPLGLGSSMSRNDGPEGFHRNIGARVAQSLFGKTSTFKPAGRL